MNSLDSVVPYIPPEAEPSPSPIDFNAPPTRDSEFYIDDQTAIFLVEHRLFKVHRYFLARESEVFAGMFTCPPETQAKVDGLSDDQPIRLPQVTAFEFKTLSRFFYHGMHSDFALSSAEWIALLSISSLYDMTKIRQRAIEEIPRCVPPIDPIEKIVQAQKHDIPEWLPSAIKDLCRRRNPLEEWEAVRIGLSITVKIARVREAVREVVPYVDLSRSIQEVFWQEGKKTNTVYSL